MTINNLEENLSWLLTERAFIPSPSGISRLAEAPNGSQNFGQVGNREASGLDDDEKELPQIIPASPEVPSTRPACFQILSAAEEEPSHTIPTSQHTPSRRKAAAMARLRVAPSSVAKTKTDRLVTPLATRSPLASSVVVDHSKVPSLEEAQRKSNRA